MKLNFFIFFTMSNNKHSTEKKATWSKDAAGLYNFKQLERGGFQKDANVYISFQKESPELLISKNLISFMVSSIPVTQKFSS